jgi:5-methylcytosine-specific restriction endonuclease McrA
MSIPVADNCYGDARVPASAEELATRFQELRKARSQRIAEQRLLPKQPRPKLDREAILEKTARRCHICGGNIEKDSYWEADHVFPASGGGTSDIGNYLPAHGLCNTAKWDQSSEELQWVLKIGVWAKKQMESNDKFGRDMLQGFWNHEQERLKRQKANRSPLEVV